MFPKSVHTASTTVREFDQKVDGRGRLDGLLNIIEDTFDAIGLFHQKVAPDPLKPLHGIHSNLLN